MGTRGSDHVTLELGCRNSPAGQRVHKVVVSSRLLGWEERAISPAASRPGRGGGGCEGSAPATGLWVGRAEGRLNCWTGLGRAVTVLVEASSAASVWRWRGRLPYEYFQAQLKPCRQDRSGGGDVLIEFPLSPSLPRCLSRQGRAGQWQWHGDGHWRGHAAYSP